MAAARGAAMLVMERRAARAACIATMLTPRTNADPRLRCRSVGSQAGEKIGAGLQQPALCRHRHCLCAGVYAQLIEDGGQVVIDGAWGEEELPPDGLAGKPSRHQAQHLSLTR